MAVAVKKGVYIVAGKRTPFGKYGGLLRDVLAEDLFATAAKAALKAGHVPPDLIDTVNIGQISPLSQTGLSPRHASLKAGIPADRPVLSISRLSGSAFDAIICSTQEILLGAAQISLAGGMENLSSVPYLVRDMRFGPGDRKTPEMEDFLRKGYFDAFCNMFLPQTADVVAAKFGITRREADEFALRSQQKWKHADATGLFNEELVSVEAKNHEVFMMRDEHPQPNVTLEKLSRLPPVFPGGVATAGNATGVNDGAATMILANDQALKDHNLKPLARVLGWSRVAVDPVMMGTAAIPAAETVLKATGLTIDDMDLVEIHEIYAATTLVCARELAVDDDKLNVNGGAIAIGHPSGVSGARIISHLTYELSPLLQTGVSPRHASLKAGIPADRPVLSISRLSGSAFDAIICSTQEILLGAAQISLAGGMENLSSVPYLVRDMRFGPGDRKTPEMEDFLRKGYFDAYCNMFLPQTADVVAAKFGVTRREADEFALRSQQKWKHADATGLFNEELVSVEAKNHEVFMMRDEHPQPNVTLEKLSRLPPVFPGGVATAGNATGINDGAATMILANDQALKDHNLKPLARVLGWSRVAVDPVMMGTTAIPAAETVLKATGLTIDDMDLVEIHEIYAATTLVCARELAVDDDKLNVNGGAIAIGHPSGVSGARIISHLTYELRRRGLRKAIASASIAGGQGIAMIIETV